MNDEILMLISRCALVVNNFVICSVAESIAKGQATLAIAGLPKAKPSNKK